MDATEEFREDAKLLGGDAKVIGICEIKGVNRGIQREYINQTDSHRERSGYPPKFPALLIVNSNIKSARTVEEKDQDLANEQIKHAVNMHILILRTFDLLGLLRLVLAEVLSKEQARELILSNVGWLQVRADEAKVIVGDE